MKPMKKFKDLGITAPVAGFVGDKIAVDRVINREIIINDFRVVDSKYPRQGNDKCLHLQITMDEKMYVVFTSSRILQESIEMVPKDDFPFIATIVRENRRLEFS